MPVFECTNCHAVENTALSEYWRQVHMEKKPPLCSECNPAIGVWHGKFEKKTPQEAGLVPDEWGGDKSFLSPPGGWWSSRASPHHAVDS